MVLDDGLPTHSSREQAELERRVLEIYGDDYIDGTYCVPCAAPGIGIACTAAAAAAPAACTCLPCSPFPTACRRRQASWT